MNQMTPTYIPYLTMARAPILHVKYSIQFCAASSIFGICFPSTEQLCDMKAALSPSMLELSEHTVVLQVYIVGALLLSC